ncbi:Phosphodiesterase/alkaline phosphatase D-like protein [hydrothermal vent metagenome]|uniref:Phosphodiesterase/alkaline phosphatase D-like protein n=1 Tax=hydrothermal vent metagenome TaxID=652676 RepID=A0A3B1BC97_9ZZZZ
MLKIGHYISFFAIFASSTLIAIKLSEIYFPPEKAITNIAFGSCARQNLPQPIWESIVNARPEIFIFMGDTIYGDSEDGDILREKYAMLGGKPGYQKLKSQTRILATWDDHDYGRNNAGLEYPGKVESQKAFLDFFKEPVNSARRESPGVYASYMFGPKDKRLQIILLDTRYFRSTYNAGDNHSAPSITMLGDTQWRWLEKELRKPAEIRIVVSSVQYVNGSRDYETWRNMPRERRRLLKLIKKTQAQGVIILSGDIHYADLSKLETKQAYPIYDLTSSGLTHYDKSYYENRYRVGLPYNGENFGQIRIDWDVEDPIISLMIRDIQGNVKKNITLRRSELTFK